MKRRTFLAAAGATGALQLLPRAFAQPVSSRFLHAALEDGSLVSAQVQGEELLWVSTVASEQPVALAAHPTLPIVYAANDCGTWKHRPRATVEAFSRSGSSLRSLGRWPLALSATGITDLAVSADGRHIWVAVGGGGAWNLLPLSSAGLPSGAAHSFKETGCGPRLEDQAHSSPFALQPFGKVWVGSDSGADRLSVLSGSARGIVVSHRHMTEPGTGPAHLASYPAAGLLAVAPKYRPALDIYRVSEATGFLQLHSTNLEEPARAALAHPTAPIVYTLLSSTIMAWHVDEEDGAPRLLDSQPLPEATRTGSLDGTTALWCATGKGLARVPLVAGGRALQRPVLIARTQGIRALLLA